MGLSRHSRSAAWAAAALLLLVPSAACSSGSEEKPAPSGPAVVPVVPTQSGEPADPAAAQAEIEKNWTAVFDPKVSAEAKAKLLENGEAMAPLMGAVGSDPRAQESAAKVTEVEFTSPAEAQVTYDLLVDGVPVLSGNKGTAVLQDGVWKVSAKTLCALVELSGNASPVPGC